MRAVAKSVSLRTRTRDQILALIRGSQGVTRPELVRLTGLSPGVVDHAVSRLIQEQRVVRAKQQEKGPGSGSGRPSVVFRAISSVLVGAIDFGHGHVRVALASDLGEVLAEQSLRRNVDLDPAAAMDAAATELTRLQREQGVELAIVVAGIPGPVDRHTGVVCSPTILSGWVGLAPAVELGRRLGKRVRVENDAALGALGELYRGAGRRHRDFLYVKVSGGIGAGVVVEGRLFTGASGLAGEIGHTALPGRTELCRCGRRGCLEAVVSIDSIREQVRHTHPGEAIEEIPISAEGDAVTQRLLEESGRILGRALAYQCNLLNPSAVIIGGELGAAGPAFLNGVRDSIRRYAQPATADVLEVLPAELGVRAELLGAIQLAGQFVG